MTIGTKAIILVLSVSLIGCYVGDPIPVECVCQCDKGKAKAKAGAVPRLPRLPRKGAKAGAKDAARAKKRAAQKGAAKGTNPLARRAADAVRRSEGRVARQPGSGDVVETDERTRKAMIQNYTAFLKGAGAKELAPVKPFLTKRLSGSLEQNLPKYKDRFFKGLQESIAAMKGAMTIKETRDMGRGNVEALVRFENGHERRVIFFKEDGDWKLNRL